MKIGLGDVMKAVDAAGSANPNAKKVSKEYNFVKDSIASIIIFLVGLGFFFFVWFIGIILMVLSVLIFFSSKKHKKRFDHVVQMRMDLRESPSLNEQVSCVFTDIENNQGRNKQGFKDELENVMILTDKRILFMYVPRVGMNDLTSGNIIGAIGNAVNYDGLKKKVKEEIKTKGVRAMVKGYQAYAMNYDEITEIKLNRFFSGVTFFYRGHKFRYSIRRHDFEEFRQIFANYIKP